MMGPLEDQIEALTGVSATRIRWILAVVGIVGGTLVLVLRLISY